MVLLPKNKSKKLLCSKIACRWWGSYMWLAVVRRCGRVSASENEAHPMTKMAE